MGHSDSIIFVCLALVQTHIFVKYKGMGLTIQTNMCD